MVERSLSMREVPGSIPGASNIFMQLTHLVHVFAHDPFYFVLFIRLDTRLLLNVVQIGEKMAISKDCHVQKGAYSVIVEVLTLCQHQPLCVTQSV